MPAPHVAVRPRALALLVAAALMAALAFAVAAQRPSTLDAGAATAGIVHIEMKITGQRTGVFKGDSLQKGHEDQILVSSYQFEVTVPRDAATGQASGRRQFHPVTITKQMNQSSPQLLFAAATSENLTKVVINFFSTTRTGTEVNYYRVTLTNASVSDVKQYSTGATVNEDVSFTFQNIEQDSLTGHTSFIADWEEVT
jgi:type VI secretion system secreted protein Hcp